jgi:hypothetical protein
VTRERLLELLYGNSLATSIYFRKTNKYQNRKKQKNKKKKEKKERYLMWA